MVPLSYIYTSYINTGRGRGIVGRKYAHYFTKYILPFYCCSGVGSHIRLPISGSLLVAPYDGSLFTFKIGSRLGKKFLWKISTRGREGARVPCRLWEKKVRGGV
ncbi:hypothetical protein 035JT004_270 [Bacillus phage 035JT004]|nr:hypothetical protein 035JT004_270 [Bacillus phage 035JT004]